ncbi:HDIG domain-containing protein [Halarsenatibacter silvermanii]|uniref:HDIG domain-containing protein n=2 Tax=Halarsenatibacter silvermanii TaxID=321763 RepID=A0A1G9RNM4_9FIRM|nr:HDIG domain-containing protein [Halarsenatibacter silvermanii]
MEMTRDEALDLVRDNISEDNLVKHCLAVEGVMRRLARYFDEDEEKWGLSGLLHDIDYEETADDEEKHSLIGAEKLEEMGLAEDIVHAVRAHNDAHDIPRRTLMAKALYASDPLTGLIVAAALVHPEKDLNEVDTEFVLNRYEETSFARGADRDVIASCSEMDLELEEFVGLGLEGMQEISEELGL